MNIALFEQWRERIGWWLRPHQAGASPSGCSVIRWESAMQVAVLGIWGNGHLSLLRFSTLLQQKGKSVTKVFFVTNASELPTSPPSDTFLLLSKERDIWRRPRVKTLHRLLQRSFDVVLNLAREEVFALHYLASIMRAPLKIGIARERYETVYDVILDVPPDHSFPQVLAILRQTLTALQKSS